MDGEVAVGDVAHVEVLMVPAHGRDEAAAFVPGDNDLLLALQPHDGVSLAAGDDDDGAGPVAVGLLIGPGRENGHVPRDLGAGELDVDRLPARAPDGESVELVPGPHVGEEVALPIAFRGSAALGPVLNGA